MTAAEVARVKQQYIAADAYKRDGTAAIASEINEWIGVGDWTLYVTFPQKVQHVTPADVQRVAAQYFKEDQSHDGLVHSGSTDSGERLVMRHYLGTALLLASAAAAADMAEQSHRDSGCGHRSDHLPHRREGRGRRIVGALPAGDAMAEPGNIAIPTLTGMMLDRGTKTLDKFAIAEQLDNVGAEIAFSVGTADTGSSGQVPARRTCRWCSESIAAELRTPALQPAEFAKAKQQFIGALEASAQNTDARAQEAFARAVFPAGHPNRPHSVTEYRGRGEIRDSR